MSSQFVVERVPSLAKLRFHTRATLLVREAPVMELADMMVSKTIAERLVGSNPTGGT